MLIGRSEELIVKWMALWNGDYAEADEIISPFNPIHAAMFDGGMPGAGAPLGTVVTFHGIDILRVENGVIVEYWLNADTLDLMTQLQVGAS